MHNTTPTYCPRDPGVETNLRCGKCGQPICPRCLVQTPVGARCRECAAERRNPVFDPSVVETGRAAAAAVMTAVGVAALAWGLLHALPPFVARYVYILAPAAAGWMIGSVTHRASGFKRSLKLQLVSGGATLLSFLAMTFVMGVTVSGFIGLAVGMWYALSRVRPPRGA